MFFVSIFVKFQVDAILNALPLVIIPVQCVCKSMLKLYLSTLPSLPTDD